MTPVPADLPRRAADARPGAYSGGLAFARQRSFAVANAPGLIVVAVLTCVAALALAVWSPGPRVLAGFAAGILLASVLGFVAHWVAVASGSTMSSMGQVAEEWTTIELRRLRRKGWRTVNSVMFRTWDVDHIAVGPNGIIVIETKWRADPIDLSDLDQWLVDATKRLRRSERDVAGHLQMGADPDAWITSVLVVWGPFISQPGEEPLRSENGVKVLAGEHLRRNLAELTDRVLDDAEITAIAGKLEKQARSRDQPEATSWQSIEGRATRALLVALVGIVGAFASLLAWRLEWWYLAVAGAFAVAGVVARSVDRFRSFGTSWLIGTQTVTVAFIVVVLVLAITS